MRMKKMLAALLCFVAVLACAAPAVSALTPHGNNVTFRSWLTNNPDYQFSDAYKTSVWYENFSELELTKNERNNVLRVAISQLGYHEGNSPDDFHGMNSSGGNNYIEYARLATPNYNNNSYAWCACFVNWCLSQARIDHAYGEISCEYWVKWLKARQLFQFSPANGGNYVPQPADFIFFEWNDGAADADHIGFVLYTTSTHVYTVEGNTSGGVVTVKSYALNDTCIIGYGTPNYQENGEETIDFSYANGAPAGYYVVYGSSVGLTQTPGGRRVARVPIGHKVAVTEVTDGYAKTSYNGREGYIAVSGNLVFLDHMITATVTFDANGGTNPPAQTPAMVDSMTTLTIDTPTLEGDTFLGWSTRPYDAVPMYEAGDKLTVAGDMTLYAVWDKHSDTLAAAATANGEMVNYGRPTQLITPYAIPAGILNMDALTPISGTGLSKIDDTTYGKVISIASNDASDDPYFTLPYAKLMKDAELPIATANEVKYIVLRVSNRSLSHKTFNIHFTCGDQASEGVVAATYESGAQWQYLVFDMSEQTKWLGTIESLRLDYEDSAAAANENVLLSDIFLLKSDAELAALTRDSLYPFPAVDKVVYEDETQAPETTEAMTDAPTEDATSAENPSVDQSTAAEGTTAEASSDEADTEADKKLTSCGSVIMTGVLPAVMIGVACLLAKKSKKD